MCIVCTARRRREWKAKSWCTTLVWLVTATTMTTTVAAVAAPNNFSIFINMGIESVRSTDTRAFSAFQAKANLWSIFTRCALFAASCAVHTSYFGLASHRTARHTKCSQVSSNVEREREKERANNIWCTKIMYRWVLRRVAQRSWRALPTHSRQKP